VVAGAGEAVAAADVTAGAAEAGPGAAPSSEPDEHARAVAVVTNDAARMRGHDVITTTIGADARRVTATVRRRHWETVTSAG
jgi:hypothetical protein